MTTNRPGGPALAFNGMAASPSELATAAGLAALLDGGTAMDAAVAANAVLTVIYPDQTAIGGDCFFVYHEAATGLLHGFNGSGRAAAAADRERIRAGGHAAMPRVGIETVTVPGTIDAWDAGLARFGRLGLERLLRPAIGYAREGFPVAPHLRASAAIHRERIAGDAVAIASYLPGGRVPRVGERLVLPDLAASLDRIARDGRDVFYEGEIAERIAATSRRLGGALTVDDLAGHRGEWVEPLVSEYRGLSVAELTPNSQGLTALVALNLVELVEPSPAWGSADHLHPLIEAKKLAFEVRDATVSDPRFTAIDTARLVSKEFAGELWRSYDPARARGGTPAMAGGTVAVCAVDRDGNAVSLIQSLYLDFGAGIVADGTGILLQSRGAAFSLDDDHPNRLEGGKRPLHTLMPGMLRRDGALVGPIGTQGGDAQAQIHLQLVTNLVDYGLDPQAAVDAPRWLSGREQPTTVTLEDRFPEETFVGLAERGHDVRRTGGWDQDFGHAQMILRDADSGLLRGGADPRVGGLALGY